MHDGDALAQGGGDLVMSRTKKYSLNFKLTTLLLSFDQLSSKVYDRNRISISLTQLRDLGIEIPPGIEEWFEKQFYASRTGTTIAASHTQNPLLGLIRALTNDDWRRYFRENSWIHPEVTAVLRGVYFQEVDFPHMFNRASTPSIRRRWLDEVSLVARRYLLWLAGQGEESACSSPRRRDYAGWFPRGDIRPGNKSYDATDNAQWTQFQERLSNLLSGRYLFSVNGTEERWRDNHRGSDESEYEDVNLAIDEPSEAEDKVLESKKRRRGKHLSAFHRDRESPVNPEAFRQFERESVCTSILSVHSYIEAPGIFLLREINERKWADPSCDDKDVAFFLVAMLSIEHGIPPRDVLHLGTGQNSPLGWIGKGLIVFNVGSTFYRSGERSFDRSQIFQPLSEELWELYREAERRFAPKFQTLDLTETIEVPRTIGHLIGIQPKKFRDQWMRYVREKVPGFAVQSTYLHQLWEKVALLDAGVPRPIAGLLRTKPLRGSQAECSYVSIGHDELLEASYRIRTALRELAGLEAPRFVNGPPLIKKLKRMRGTNCPTFKQYWDRTRECVLKAESHNELIACTVRFLRGLSVRHATRHFQPSYYIVEQPEPALEILDKPVNATDRVRYIPITDEIGDLAAACSEKFPGIPEMLYEENGRLVGFKQFGGRKTLDSILENFSSARQEGRTAFFSALLRAECGEAIRNVLMGHGTSIFQPYSEHGLLSVGDWIRQSREALRGIFAECGINETAIILAEKIRRHCQRCRIDRSVGGSPELPRHGVCYFGANLDAGSISPPLPIEHWLIERVRNEIDKKKVEATPQSLAMHLVYRFGVPVNTLLRMAPYVRFRDVVEFGEWIYILMPLEHEDKGGISRLPLRLCRDQDGEAFAVIVRRMWDRLKAINPGVRDSNLAERSMLVPTRIPEGSKFIKQMKSRGKEASSHFRFHAAIHLCRHSAAKSFAVLLRDRPIKERLDASHRHALSQRLGEIVCAWQHPAIVFGAMRAQSRRGLNSYSIDDLFALIDAKLEARILVSRASIPPIHDQPPVTQRDVDSLLQDLRIGKRALPKKRKDRVAAIAALIYRKGLQPNYRIVRSLLRTLSLRINAEEIFAERLCAGYAVDTSELPLLSKQAMHEVVAAAEVTLQNMDLRVGLPNRQDALPQYLNLLSESGFRLSEPIRLLRGQSIMVGNSAYLFVKRGKTQNSRRVVTQAPHPITGRFLPSLERVMKRPIGDLEVPLLALFKKPASDSKAISRSLGKVSEGKISPHDLRHHIAVFSVQEIIRTQLLRGNYHTAMTTLARRLGHGSMSVTEYSYIGTAVAFLRLPPTEKIDARAHSRGWSQVRLDCTHGKPSTIRLGLEAEKVAGGGLAKEQSALRILRKYENEVRKLGRSNSLSCMLEIHDDVASFKHAELAIYSRGEGASLEAGYHGVFNPESLRSDRVCPPKPNQRIHSDKQANGTTDGC